MNELCTIITRFLLFLGIVGALGLKCYSQNFPESDQKYSKDSLTIEDYLMKEISSVKLKSGHKMETLVSIIHSSGAKTFKPNQVPLPFAKLWGLGNNDIANFNKKNAADHEREKDALLLMEIAKTGKLPLIEFSYENGKLTKDEAIKLGFYRVDNKSTLKLRFYCTPQILAQSKHFKFRFKVSRKKNSASKSTIMLRSQGKELVSRKGVKRGKWISMIVPIDEVQQESTSLEIILSGGSDKVHVECKEGVPLVEMNTGLQTIDERKQEIAKRERQKQHREDLIKNAKRMQMRAIKLASNGVSVNEFFWFNSHNTRITENKPAFIVGYPKLKQLVEGDLLEGYFAEDGTVDIGTYRNKKVVRKLRWIRHLKSK